MTVDILRQITITQTPSRAPGRLTTESSLLLFLSPGRKLPEQPERDTR